MEPGEAEDADDHGPFRSPLPPEDRLWRHPSELGAPVVVARGRAPWVLAAVSGLTGAVLAVGVLAAAGLLDRSASHEVVVREVASTPTSGAVTDDVVRVVAAASPAVVRIIADGHELSGVVYRDDGHVLTSAHVVAGARHLRAVLADGRTLDAHLVAADRDSDVALVKLAGSGPFPTAMLGSTDGVAVGQTAIAVGAGPAVSTGVVSAIGREVPLGKDGPMLLDMLQTDAAVTSASSGGALLDRRGAVLGITAGSSGVAYAVPVDVARAVGDELLRSGRVRSVWLGIRGETPDGVVGVRVLEVAKGSPAAGAGIHVGDLVSAVDGHPVATMTAIRTLLRRHHPDDRVRVTYDRAGSAHTATLALVERAA